MIANDTDEQNLKQEEDFPENSYDLAADKRENNILNATENSATNQFFIQNANFDGKEIYRLFETPSNDGSEKSYDLRKVEDCAKFVEFYKGGEYLALAIVLCTFEIISLGDLPNLKMKLIENFPQVKVLNDEGREAEKPQQDSYISLNSMLSVIGGKIFITDDGQRCTGFGEDSEKALVNMWEQFPGLRNNILSWLIDSSGIFEYRTAFDAYQVTAAFVRVISLDFVDAKKNIFARLYSNPNNAGLLGALAYELYKKPEFRKEILEIGCQWAASNSHWLWKPACILYSNLDGENVSYDLEKCLRDSIKKRLLNLNRSDLIFISMFICYSKNARSMLSAILNEIFHSKSVRNFRNQVASTYVRLIRFCYYGVDQSLTELPLVACDTREQQSDLEAILKQVMSVYPLRRQLYAIMEAYLNEAAGYNLSSSAVKHLTAYFCNISSSGTDIRRDVMSFLKNCKGDIAKQILKRMDGYFYAENGGLLK